jgi:hypothetical protein
VRVPSDRVGAADLLATLVDGRTLARLTGRPLWDARARQTWLGQDRDTRQARIAIDSGWLGKLPDQEVADRLRIHRPLIAHAREQLGVESPRRPRGLGARLRASPEMTARIARGLSTLSPRERKIVRARALDWPQRTLGDLGRELGLTRERVRQIDAHALRTLGVLPV